MIELETYSSVKYEKMLFFSKSRNMTDISIKPKRYDRMVEMIITMTDLVGDFAYTYDFFCLILS